MAPARRLPTGSPVIPRRPAAVPPPTPRRSPAGPPAPTHQLPAPSPAGAVPSPAAASAPSSPPLMSPSPPSSPPQSVPPPSSSSPSASTSRSLRVPPAPASWSPAAPAAPAFRPPGFPLAPRCFTELVRTQQLVMASLGDDVNFRCELTKQKNVKQVTWQSVSEQKSENMATYSDRFGATVTGPFRKNVYFVETGLQQCSIVIRRVQWSDESCYKCLFNVFPDGAISGRTCLKIYELHNPIFEVNPVNFGDDRRLSLSCSATGRPAPEVSWSIEDTALENSTTFYTKNPNGTITLSKTAIVQITPRHLANTTQIKCAAQQEFGERKETFVSIPNDDIPSDTRPTIFSYTVPAAVLGVLCVFFGFFLRKKNDCGREKFKGQRQENLQLDQQYHKGFHPPHPSNLYSPEV